MARECGRRRYWKEVREIADSEGVPVPEARRLWRERARRGAAAATTAARQAVRAAIAAIRLRPVESQPVCPYCRDDLASDDATAMGCPRCSALYHGECWEEAGCATIGCAWRPPRAEREARRLRVAARERQVTQDDGMAEILRVVLLVPWWAWTILAVGIAAGMLLSWLLPA